MTDLTIETGGNVPDTTYFARPDAEPELEGSTLTIFDGRGSRRGWGAPSVTSTVVLHDPDLVAVHVGFSHKHRGGQFWRYYRQDVSEVDGATVTVEWEQNAWARLSDEERQRILDAAKSKAPNWAKTPGKLRVEKRAPYSEKHLRYKIVRVAEDGSLVSGYAGDEVRYELGKVLIQKARPEHMGGYYVYDSSGKVLERFNAGRLFPSRVYDEGGSFALVECEVSGTCVEYDAAGYRVEYWYDEGNHIRTPDSMPEKEAWTYIRPLRVIQSVEYMPAVAHAS